MRRQGGARRSGLPAHSASGRGQAADGGRPAAPGGYRRRLRVARALMVTPWFAASAGIVIAAAMAVDSPAALTYAPSSPGVRCPTSGCSSPAPGHGPALATASPGVALDTPGAEPGRVAAGSGPHPGAAAGAGAVYQVGYQIIRRWPSGFVAMITMPGDLNPGTWSLQFAFPAARVDRVWGALWQPSDNGHGGTALGPWQWHGPAPGGPEARQLTVSATGAPTDPSGCKLDGFSCSFG